eukprot:355685-Hanusia_phi.AAC.1
MKSSVSGWPGTISIAEIKDPDSSERECFIVDGQHRLAACMLLSSKEKENAPVGADKVIVEVYPDMQDQNTTDLFVEINKAEPVSECTSEHATRTLTELSLRSSMSTFLSLMSEPPPPIRRS